MRLEKKTRDTEQVKGNKMQVYKCSVHAKGLLPLLCKDCDGPVCLDCLTTNHVGHKMCKPSECIEDKFSRLNDAIQGKESARFNWKQIKENLQKNQGRLKDKVEKMVQRVTEREGEILKEVKNVCQKTIKQIKELAMDIEIPMKNAEKILNTFMTCDEFQNDNDEEFIKCLYFYNDLKLLQDKYVARGQNVVPFSLESCDLSLVGSVVTVEHSSDEDPDNTGILPLLHESSIHDKKLPHQYKKKTNFIFDNVALVSPERKFLCWDYNLFHLSTKRVTKLAECVKAFTYVSETDEIIYVSDN